MVTSTSYPQLAADNRNIIGPENLNIQAAKSASKKMSFKVTLARKLYYGNDNVKGTVLIKADDPTELKVVRVAVSCRMRWRYGETSSIYTVYTEKKTLALKFLPKQGLNTLPFAFGLPAEVLSSLEHNLLNVCWDVRLLSTDDAKSNNTVAYSRFQVSSLYYSSFLSPRTQGEVNALTKNTVAVRAEASLTRDVHVAGEPLHCDISLMKLHANTKVRRVKASLKQHVTSQYKNDHINRSAVIDSATISHLSRLNTWETLSTDNNNAQSISLTLGLVADVKKLTSRVALQKHSNGQFHLTPSTCIFSTSSTPGLSVSYSVEVCVETSSSVDLVLSVPFTLQGSTQTQLSVTNLEDCITFAVTNDSPPMYDDYVCESESTFCATSLHSDDSHAKKSNRLLPLIPGSPFVLKRLRSYSRGSKPRKAKRTNSTLKSDTENRPTSPPAQTCTYKRAVPVC